MKFLIPLGLVALFAVAWTSQGWAGIAMVGGGVVMWALLHFTRMLTVLKRAADRPKGWVDSAVMLNAKLRPGVNLLHIMALTRSHWASACLKTVWTRRCSAGPTAAAAA
jgi:hypothetical protein